MAHNLNIVNGKAAFMSLRQSAWHGLGQIVDAPPSSAEAIKLAGLDWRVDQQGLYRADMDGLPDYRVNVRSDTKNTLGVVSKDYQVLQNHEMFDWFKGLDGFAEITLETAGALGVGETVWVLAYCKGLDLRIGDDVSRAYMLVCNGHDGTRALTVKPTTVRVVCANTLAMATRVGTTNTLVSGFSIRHHAGIRDAFRAIQNAYKRTTANWKLTEDIMRRLASVPYTSAHLERLFVEPWDDAANDATDNAALVNRANALGLSEADRASVLKAERERAEAKAASAQARTAARVGALHKLLDSDTCKVKGTAGSLYAALNAVTEYIDHEAPTRTKAGDAKAAQSARFQTSMFGAGERLKRDAFDLVLAMAE